MVVFAITQLGTIFLALSFGVCIALIASAFWPIGWRSNEKTTARRLAWVFLAPLEFAVLWLWLNPIIGILLWIFVFGDNFNDSRTNAYVRLPAALIAVVTSAAVALRLGRGVASRRFARMHLWATVLLLVMYGGTWGSDYLSRFEGTTAQSAAESFMARHPAHLLEGARLVERPCNLGSPKDDSSRHRCYWIMVANEPKARFSVSRMGWFAWTVGSSKSVEPLSGRLERAKELIRSGDPDTAKFILKELIEEYPDTADGVEAVELLRTLPESSKTRRLDLMAK